MGAEEARHLLNRTGFDARIEEVDAFAALSRNQAVDKLLGAVRSSARTPAPEGISAWTPPYARRQMSGDERKLFVREQVERGLALKAWWLKEMLETDSQLTERMTLFWHNHFTSSLQKVRATGLMYRQNALLRRHALGSFAELLRAAAKDPAMLVYLDSATNRRGQPNENFAREVMELFTLGEGKYDERDIKEAARAFTGWSIDPESGEFLWRPFQHDSGVKTVLGRSGDFRGEDVIEILLEQPATAEFIVGKLWKEFVSPRPDAAEVARVARLFRGSGYQIRPALRELLLGAAFWAAENRGALVKSPVELVVGTLRQFGVAIEEPLPFVLLLRNLGQDILSPPNVKGWTGGEAWIDSRTLLARKQFLERLMRVDETRVMAAAVERNTGKPMAARFARAIQDLRFSAQDWLKPYAGREEDVALVLLALPPAKEPVRTAGAELRFDAVRALVADPVYQLK
jgi:uncharacterized protein (DUF1800 family)